jgi:hypothetical protein
MTAWIVVESMFGNTRQVADEIAGQLISRMQVELRDVSEAPLVMPDDLSLLVVGGPTHAFGMTREGTRAEAVKRGSDAEPTIGVRDWLGMVALPRPDVPAVAFDTRVNKHLVPGAASRGISRKLDHLGCVLVEAPISFLVHDVKGPLLPAELERAAKFGAMVVHDLERRGLLAESA